MYRCEQCGKIIGVRETVMLFSEAFSVWERRHLQCHGYNHVVEVPDEEFDYSSSTMPDGQALP